jgi:hypothetical protein
LTPTRTPTPTQPPTLASYPQGYITAPILLYHHVADNGNGIRYFVSRDDFRSQMKALHEWGYTTITTSILAQTITSGGDLPGRPVIISFDDGYADVYQMHFYAGGDSSAPSTSTLMRDWLRGIPECCRDSITIGCWLGGGQS